MRRLPAAVDRLPLHVRVAAELEALEPRDRQVLALCLLEKLTPLEAAGTLRMTVSQIECRLVATLSRLSAAVGAPRKARRAARRAA